MGNILSSRSVGTRTVQYLIYSNFIYYTTDGSDSYVAKRMLNTYHKTVITYHAIQQSQIVDWERDRPVTTPEDQAERSRRDTRYSEETSAQIVSPSSGSSLNQSKSREKRDPSVK